MQLGSSSRHHFIGCLRYRVGAEVSGAMTLLFTNRARRRIGTGESRLDRAEIDVEDFRDFFVREPFYFAQDDDGAEARKLTESGFDALAVSAWEA